MTSAASGRGRATAFLFPDQVPRDGSRIPALAAVLAALPAARFTIEVKTDPAHPAWTEAPDVLADATLAVIDAAGAAARVIVESFDWRVQRHIRKTRRDIRLAWLTAAETVRNAALVVGRGDRRRIGPRTRRGRRRLRSGHPITAT